MRLPCLSLSSVVDDTLLIFFVKRLFCDWQFEPAICEDVLVSSFFATCLFNVSRWVCNLVQTHAIPYSLVGFRHAFQVRICTCISRSREHIREFESNNSLECCHEVRLGRQNVPTKKVHSGKERKMYIRACKLYDLQVSGPLCPSLYFGSLWRRVNARNVSLLTIYGGLLTSSTQLLTLNYLPYSPTNAVPQFL